MTLGLRGWSPVGEWMGLLSRLSLELKKLEPAKINRSRAKLRDPFGFQVKFQVYESEAPGAQFSDDQVTVLILPPTGGLTWLEHRYAKMLVRKGMRAILVESWSGDDERSLDLGLHDRHLKRVFRALQMILSEFPKGRFRVLGTSLGALYGLSALARLERVEAGVLITCGAPFSKVIGESEHINMRSLREERMRIFGIQHLEDYVSVLDKKVKWNDLDLIRKQVAGQKKVFQVISESDVWVPSRWQSYLAELLGPSQILRLPSPHVRAIVETHLFHSEKVVRFLNDPHFFRFGDEALA